MAVVSRYGVDASTVGEDYLLFTNPAWRSNAQPRLIVATHGRSNTASQWVQTSDFLGRHAVALVETGRYMVLSVSAGGPTAFSNPASQTSIANGVAYGQSLGARAGKYGMIGYSMGGLAVWNRIKRDPANIAGAWLWSPLSDLAWANTNPTYTPEIAASFGSYTASAGYRVADEPATFTNLSVKVKVAHPTDDATVPYSQSSLFLAAVNNPLMSMRTPDIVGGHTGQMRAVPDAEIVAFFDSLNW